VDDSALINRVTTTHLGEKPLSIAPETPTLWLTSGPAWTAGAGFALYSWSLLRWA